MNIPSVRYEFSVSSSVLMPGHFAYVVWSVVNGTAGGSRCSGIKATEDAAAAAARAYIRRVTTD